MIAIITTQLSIVFSAKGQCFSFRLVSACLDLALHNCDLWTEGKLKTISTFRIYKLEDFK